MDYMQIIESIPEWDECSAIRKAQIVFCILTALNFLRTLPQLFDFYSWFSTCGLEISKHRGFGQTACKSFGVIPNPPGLSKPSFLFAALSLVLCLFASCLDVAPRLFLALGLALYWLFLAQLYCEAHVGAHVTVLIPPMLFVCMMSPSLTAGPSLADALPLVVLKLVLTSAYCSAGLSKVIASVKNGVFWGDGATLQFYIYESLMINKRRRGGFGAPHFSFGVPTPFSFDFQEFLFRCPRLCALLSVKSLMFETFAPAILLFPQFDLFFAPLGVGFHYGIALFQNIDFVTWWGPFYAVFLFGNYGIRDISMEVWNRNLALSQQTIPFSCVFVVAYLLLHLGGIIYATLTGAEILPLSSFHMFSAPKNLWDPRIKKHFYLTTKAHATGTLKNYAFPFARPQHVLPREMRDLPFKYFVMVNTGEGVETFGNVFITAKFREVMTKVTETWNRGSKSYLDSEQCDAALQLLDVAKEEFSHLEKIKKMSS